MSDSAPRALPRTLLDKVWDRSLVRAGEGEPDLLYVGLHLVHEVTSAQAFEALAAAGRGVRRPDLTIATVDHNVPTTDRSLPVLDLVACRQMDAHDGAVSHPHRNSS